MSDLKAAAERHEQAMRAAVIAAANGEPLPDEFYEGTNK